MEAELALDGVGPDDVAALRRMIDSDVSLRGLRFVPAGQQQRGEMSGPAVDLIQVVFGPGGTGVAFAGVLIAWLRSRRKRITVEVKAKGGSVKVSAEGMDDPAALTERIARVIS